MPFPSQPLSPSPRQIQFDHSYSYAIKENGGVKKTKQQEIGKKICLLGREEEVAAELRHLSNLLEDQDWENS